MDEGAIYGYGGADLGRISRVGFGSQFDGGVHRTLGWTDQGTGRAPDAHRQGHGGVQSSGHKEEVSYPELQRASGQGAPSTPRPTTSGRVRRDVDEVLGYSCEQA